MSKHRDIISIEREADQHVQVTIGQHAPHLGQQTDGGGSIPGGFSQLFNRVISTLAYAHLPEAAKLVYPALVWMADHRRQFVIENRGYSEIARYAGVSRSTAQKGLARLIDSGLVRLARAARPNGLGGLTANVYQLLVPIEGVDTYLDQPARTDERPHTVSRDRGVPHRDTPPSRQPAHPSPAKQAVPVPRNGRYKQEEESQDNNTARAQLAAAGVREPVLSKLIRENSQEELLLRLKDWQTRTAAGAKLGAAWLIASIRDRYELHESTRSQLDREKKLAAASAHRIARLEQQSREEQRQLEIERDAAALFESMSDEELAHWKQLVVEELPSMFRNPEKLDPRTHARLKRMILGKLAHLVG
jgi:hypothetical protein